MHERYQGDFYGGFEKRILVAWHDKVMMLPGVFQKNMRIKLHALISTHNDGRIIADTIKLMKYQVIEGSSNRNSTIAVKQILRALKGNENIIITPDGPRGPRHRMKGSVIEIAKITNASIIPLAIAATNYISLRSWDRLIFPLPFGRITVRFGEPIVCDRKTQLTLSDLESILNNLGVQ